MSDQREKSKNYIKFGMIAAAVVFFIYLCYRNQEYIMYLIGCLVGILIALFGLSAADSGGPIIALSGLLAGGAITWLSAKTMSDLSERDRLKNEQPAAYEALLKREAEEAKKKADLLLAERRVAELSQQNNAPWDSVVLE